MGIFLMKKICGIYKITSPSGRVYVGQSVDIYGRWNLYKRLGCKRQIKLYNSLKKYGCDAHSFEIIEECLPEQLNEREIYRGNFYNVFNSKNGLNLRECGGNHGKHSEETKQKLREFRHSEETKKMLSKILTGKKRTEETKQKLRELAQKGITGRRGMTNSKEHSQKIRESLLGSHHSEETKQKIRLANLGKKHSEETKQKMREFRNSEETKKKMREHRHTEESKIKISNSLKGRGFSEEHRKNLSKSMMGNKNFSFQDYNSEERNKKISESLTGKKLSKEHIEKIRKKLKGRKLSEEHRQKVIKNLIPNNRARKTKRKQCTSIDF